MTTQNVLDVALNAFGLSQNYTIEELKRVFRTLVLKFHPDRGGDKLIFDYIMEQYNILRIYATARDAQTSMFDKMKEQSLEDVRNQSTQGAKTIFSDSNARFNVDKFNEVYNQTKVADIHDQGYENWFRGQTQEAVRTPDPKAVTSSNFNDQFAKSRPVSKMSQEVILVPEAFQVASTSCGYSYLGENDIEDFTGGTRLQYVDLKKAHTNTCLIDPDAIPRRKEYRSVQEYEMARSNIGSLSPEEAIYMKEQQKRAEKEEEERKKRLFQRDHVAANRNLRASQLLLSSQKSPF